MEYLVSQIAIIPARGGSKRIPRKNIVPFRGRPMISWTISAALESEVFDTVLVSTDDPEIAEVARSEGADVPFLRQDHADDHSPVSAAVLTALDQAESSFGRRYETVAQLMPNCPLRGARDIRAAWDRFQDGPHLFQISCFAFNWMNPWWAARLKANGEPDWLFPEARLSRSQDLQRLYCPTGAIWIVQSEAFRAAGTFYGPGHVMVPMPWIAAVDIDDVHDLLMAEAMAIVAERQRQDAGAGL